jgi:hypothetical protein
MLHKFRDDLDQSDSTKSPPFVISASKLDKNFGLCYLLPVDGNNAAYTIDRSSDGGYKLQGSKVFDVCENGRPVKYRFFAAKESTQQG